MLGALEGSRPSMGMCWLWNSSCFVSLAFPHAFLSKTHTWSLALGLGILNDAGAEIFYRVLDESFLGVFRTTSLSSVPLLTGCTGPAVLRECPLESALSQEVTKFLYLGRCERGADFELTGSEGAPHAWQRPCLLE